MLVTEQLDGTREHEFQTSSWITCACGLGSDKRPETQNSIVVSTDKPAVNLQDLVNTVLQRTDGGWKCPSSDCSHRKQATSLSTTTFFGEKIIVFLKRPFHQPRTDVQVPMQISIATYQDGEIAATMVNGYIQYIVMHSTRGGNVPDAGNPKSTSNKDQGGHYFGCEAMWPESNRSPTGCIVDCMADVPNETCDMDKWVTARGRKVVAVMYTTVQQPWMDVVPLPFSFVCGCVGEGVIKSWNHHIPGADQV